VIINSSITVLKWLPTKRCYTAFVCDFGERFVHKDGTNYAANTSILDGKISNMLSWNSKQRFRRVVIFISAYSISDISFLSKSGLLQMAVDRWNESCSTFRWCYV